MWIQKLKTTFLFLAALSVSASKGDKETGEISRTYLSVYTEQNELHWFYCKQASFNEVAVHSLSSLIPQLGFDPEVTESSFHIGMYDAEGVEQVACRNPYSVFSQDKLQLGQSGIDAVLVSRGSCSFAEKVKNTQTRGAELVIIADNTNKKGPEPMNLDADDITGINIPACALNYNDGQTLKALLGESKNGVLPIGVGTVTGRMEILGPTRFEKDTVYSPGDIILFKWSAPVGWKVDLVLVPVDEGEEEEFVVADGVLSSVKNPEAMFDASGEEFAHYDQTIEYEYEDDTMFNVFEWTVPSDFKSGTYYQSVEVPGSPFLQDLAPYALIVEADSTGAESGCEIDSVAVNDNNFEWVPGEPLAIDIKWTQKGAIHQVTIKLVDANNEASTLHLIAEKSFSHSNHSWIVPQEDILRLLGRNLKVVVTNTNEDGETSCSAVSISSFTIHEFIEAPFEVKDLKVSSPTKIKQKLFLDSIVILSWVATGQNKAPLDVYLEKQVGESFAKVQTVADDVDPEEGTFQWKLPVSLYDEARGGSQYRFRVRAPEAGVGTYSQTFSLRLPKVHLKKMSFSKENRKMYIEWTTTGYVSEIVARIQCTNDVNGYLDASSGGLSKSVSKIPNFNSLEVTLSSDFVEQVSADCSVHMYTYSLDQYSLSDPSFSSGVSEKVNFQESFAIDPSQATPEPNEPKYFIIIATVAAAVSLVGIFVAFYICKRRPHKESTISKSYEPKRRNLFGRTASTKQMLRRSSSIFSVASMSTNISFNPESERSSDSVDDSNDGPVAVV